jgi:hypothetical protein
MQLSADVYQTPSASLHSLSQGNPRLQTLGARLHLGTLGTSHILQEHKESFRETVG